MQHLVSRRTFLKQNTLTGIGLGIAPGLLSEHFTPNRFTDHGVASPIGQHRGIVATTDANGRDIVLLWLFDHRGGYGLLWIDVETGESEQFDMPFPPGDAPYASLLSSTNKFYTLFKGHFVEFDPFKKKFTAAYPTHGAAMALTEDDQGVIWATTYPKCGLTAYDPEKATFTDYGFVNDENWLQYPRTIACDKEGWVYTGIGYTNSQIVAFNPRTKETRHLLQDDQRKQGAALVYRNQDGNVYGQSLSSDAEPWLKISSGKVQVIDRHTQDPVPYIAGSQTLFHRNFKSGKKIKDLDLIKSTLTIADTTGQAFKSVPFNYKSEGAIIMGVAAGPDKKIYGGTTFPMRQFSFNPSSGEWKNFEAYGQFNTLESDEKQLYIGGYPGGFLLQWDPKLPFQTTKPDVIEGNPRYLGSAKPDVYRPFRILIHPYDDTVICTGSPAYGQTGGGMMIWNKKLGEMRVLNDRQLIPNQSTMSLVALNKRVLLGGTTTQPGTGGEKKAQEAVLYLFEKDQITWNKALIPGAQQYNDLIQLPNGKIAGFADQRQFFVFDYPTRTIEYQIDTEKDLNLGRTVLEQGPRIFVKAPNNLIYVLFRKGIALLNPRNYQLELIAEAPQPIRAGGAYLDGSLWFVCESHLWSYRI